MHWPLNKMTVLREKIEILKNLLQDQNRGSKPEHNWSQRGANLIEGSPVKSSARFLWARPRRDPAALCTIFPFSGFSMSTSLCSLTPEEKQTPPLLPPFPSSSPFSSTAGFLLFPLCPLGFFMAGLLTQWPLPCIRLHVYIYAQQNRKEQYVMKYENEFLNAHILPQIFL